MVYVIYVAYVQNIFKKISASLVHVFRMAVNDDGRMPNLTAHKSIANTSHIL